MSAVSRIMVFPEGRSAQEVLAVDLDDDSVDYFSTYPGTAKWVSNPERLREDLARVGKKPEHVPEVVPGLLENLLRSSSITLALPPMLSLLGGSLILIAIVLFPGLLIAIVLFPGLDFLNVFVRLIIGLAAGAGTAWLIIAPSRKKIRRSIAADEERKGIYNERLREADDHFISIDDPDADDVREALARADAINDNLKLIRRYGLSTIDEAEALDGHLANLLRAHIAERSAQPNLERFEAVLRDVDPETIAADADLQNIQQLRDKLLHTVKAAEEKTNSAKNELNQLEKATTISVRQTEAKIQAAELTGQEGTEL